jgi:superfamily II DNA or RNA helicase
MSLSMSLRRWQQEALQKFESSRDRDFLAVATPGAGKTTFALTACVRALEARRASRVVVVAPTQHLKHQWADAAERFGLILEPEWASSDGALPSDMHGVLVTYQQVAASPRALAALAKDAFGILDEIHHAADSRAWGDGIRIALRRAARRLCLSGTPFRSDQNAIPFVRYRGDDAEPHYEYGYGEALADRHVVRPVYFPRIGGRMEWSSPDGTSYAAAFDDAIGRTLSSQRLRTALSLENEWLPSVIAQANRQLTHLRETDPSAGGMVIAMDQDHAKSIADLLRVRFGVRATVATSDDPESSEKIGRYARCDSPWIVAVRMVSEGVDIPRLRVGVYATNTSTDLFFRQAVGRLVRWTPGAAGQKAYMFIPDDPRIRGYAQGIRDQRRHSLRKEAVEDDGLETEKDEEGEVAGEDEQLSLFAVISAVPLDEHGQPLRTEEIIDEKIDEGIEECFDDIEVEHDLGDIPLPVVEPTFQLEPMMAAPIVEETSLAPPALLPGDLTNRERKKQLRAMNVNRAKQLSRRVGMTHSEVNAELNRRIGIRRVTEASQDQLQRRIRVADAWLRRL